MMFLFPLIIVLEARRGLQVQEVPHGRRLRAQRAWRESSVPP